jgi:hypothetical protein
LENGETRRKMKFPSSYASYKPNSSARDRRTNPDARDSRWTHERRAGESARGTKRSSRVTFRETFRETVNGIVGKVGKVCGSLYIHRSPRDDQTCPCRVTRAVASNARKTQRPITGARGREQPAGGTFARIRSAGST